MCLDFPKPAPAPAAAPAQSFNPGLLDATLSSAPIPNNQDMFDKAFGAPNSSPFGAPPVVMVQRFPQTHIYTTTSVTVIIYIFSQSYSRLLLLVRQLLLGSLLEIPLLDDYFVHK